MKVNKIVVLRWMMIFVGFWIVSYSQGFCENTKKDTSNKNCMVKDSSMFSWDKSIDEEIFASFDSILVIHYHPTAQCSCCINVGNFAKKGLEKFYAKLYKDDRIVFRERNSEEDSLTVRKYHLLESALAFQKFSGENNEFKEIESVWEFCEDEEKFLISFRNELDQFMNDSKKDKPRAKTQSKKSE